MPAAAVGIGAAGSIVGGIMQGQGYNNAIDAIKQYTDKAIGSYKDYSTQGLNELGNFWNTQQQNEQPYINQGRVAVDSLGNMLQPGGELSQGYGQQFQAPTAEQAAQTPGYQFALQQGQQALERSAAAKGNLLTGGTAKALDQYSQGMASQNYQNAYNNALQGFNTNYGIWNNDRNNLFSRYASLSGLGQNSAAGLNANAGNMANMYNSNLLTTGGQIGSAYQNEAQGIASADIGKGQAYAGMFNGLGQSGSNYMMLNKMMQ